jgi:hypothetical protein
VGCLLGIFLLSRVIVWCVGVRFDISPLSTFYQYLDVEWLRHDLLRSLYYQHSQPPAFNALVGVVLKLFASCEGYAFAAIFYPLSFLGYVCTYCLMAALGIGRKLALLLSTLLVLSPSWIVGQNWLFYDFPIAVMLLATALAYHRYLATDRLRWLITMSVLLLGLCLVRSMFHLLFLAVLGACLILYGPRRRRQLTLAFAATLLLASTVYVKNYFVFGRFAASTWLGMSAYKNVHYAHRVLGIDMGETTGLCDVGHIRPFSPLEKYPDSYRQARGFDHVPALKEPRRSTGATNFNHVAYIDISDAYLRDTLVMLRKHPKALLITHMASWYYFFQPLTCFWLVTENTEHLGWYARVWDMLFYGHIPLDVQIGGKHGIDIYPLLTAGILAAVGYAVVAVWPRRRGTSRLPPASRGALLFILLVTVHVAVAGNVLEVEENFRFSFYLAPLLLTCFGLFLQQVVVRRLARGRRRE